MAFGLSQAQMEEPFQTTVPNVKAQLSAAFEKGGRVESATIKFCLQVRSTGYCSVYWKVRHGSRDCLVSGLTKDDQLLKGPGQGRYREELLVGRQLDFVVDCWL